MLRTKLPCLLVLIPLALASCSKGPKGPPTPKTTKVGGTLLIDGKPAPKGNIELKLYKKGSDQAKAEVVANCLVGDEGKYQFNSYREGDGAVPGEYVLSMEWLRPAPGMMYGPDKFLNNFNSPFNEDPRFQVEVLDGAPVEISPIEITMSELKPQKMHPYATPTGKKK
jgi:hypothetical protein